MNALADDAKWRAWRSSTSARAAHDPWRPSATFEGFADHMGDVEYHGLEGVRRSTASYRALLDDLRFGLVDQVAESDRVASRWLMTGSNRGRSVRTGDHDQPPA